LSHSKVWKNPPQQGSSESSADSDSQREGISRNPRIVRRIAKEASPFSVHLAAIFFLDLLATPLLLLNPLPLAIVVDLLSGSDPLPTLLEPLVPNWFLQSEFRMIVFAAILQVLVVMLAQLQEVTQYVLRTYTGEKLTLGFRSKLFRHAQRLSLSFHDTRGTADSVYRIQYDAPAIQHVTIYGFITFAASAFMLLITIFVIARIDWQLSLVALVVSPPLFLLARYYNRNMRPAYTRVHELDSSAMGVIQEVLSSFRVVKAFGREDREEQRFVTQSGRSARAQVRLSLAEGAFGLVVNLVIAAGTAVVVLVGAMNVLAGRTSLGDLVLVFGYLTQLYLPLKTISEQIADVQWALASMERSFELMDEVPEVLERPHARHLARARGRIEFSNVSFSYDRETPVLQDVSFVLEAGRCLGITGPTGAGKSTLVSLLMRFYDPSQGCILLDGVDIRDYRLADIRSQFSMVLQEPVLFSTTIVENINYARPSASFDEIVQAARAAGAHEFITALPESYDTMVGERGMRLSGGERQRISIARAFLKDTPILILDEPTSSVDLRTEADIIEATHRLMENRTALMIAHRLSTLERCDARLELDQGRVVAASDDLRAHIPTEIVLEVPQVERATR
jgi:ATP-binding cassette subfamily B protein